MGFKGMTRFCSSAMLFVEFRWHVSKCSLQKSFNLADCLKMFRMNISEIQDGLFQPQEDAGTRRDHIPKGQWRKEAPRIKDGTQTYGSWQDTSRDSELEAGGKTPSSQNPVESGFFTS